MKRSTTLPIALVLLLTGCAPAMPSVAPVAASPPTAAPATVETAATAVPTVSSTVGPTPAPVPIVVGSWTPPRSQLHDSLSAAERAELAEAGVCAEVCAVLLDAEGNQVAEEFTERCISIGSAALRAIPDVIAVAGGDAKALAMKAIIAGGCANSLVVDTSLATAMLS